MSNTEEKNSDSRRTWSDLGPRLLSALVLIPVTALLLYLGGVWVAALIGAVFAGAYREWEIMITGNRLAPVGFILIASVFLAGIAFPLYGIVGSASILVLAMGLALLMPSPSRLWRAAGIAYFGLVVLALLAIRGTGSLGIVAGVFLTASVWLTDSAAFFAGRQLGGRKLMPEVSPSKTWSGALGGLFVATVGAGFFWVFVTPSAWWIGFGFAALLSVAGQLGDLAESAIKRRFKVKDSGDLIPGHGGLMDRLDSLTIAAFLVFLIGALHADVDNVATGFLIW